MTDREALKIAFNALVEIDRQTPYPIAKHAIKCINAAFNTIQEIDAVLENERKEAAEYYLSLIREAGKTHHVLIGYADKYDLERDGHDFWVSREPGKDTVPIYKGKNGD